MNRDIARLLRSGSAALAPDDALRAPIDALIGVDAAASEALAGLEIRTIFDLAASHLFANAAKLLALEDDPSLAEARFNVVAADVAEVPSGVPLRELARQPVAVLRGLAGHAEAIATALDVATVRDLAVWPPYIAATKILAAALLPAGALVDPDSPPELLPKSGVYPTERVFYRKLLVDAEREPGGAAHAIEEADPIDLAGALAQPAGFARLATGALLTFSQSWYAQGLTLGQLLHSTSLAPGESTRIAVLDWSRRSRAAASEDITESELLSNTMAHSRAVSEVTTATASEFQSGRSSMSATSTTEQSGAGFGLDLGFFGLGGSGSSAKTTTQVMSASSSFGARDLAADYAQQINDRSQQNASSVRNRRASVVREVSQSEHEEVSTRVVTNYNHMHALSIHYYEVVQVYRTVTQLERAERCLFVPVKLVDFSDAATIARWRLVLADAALTARARRQLTVEYGVVEIVPQTPRVTPGSIIASGLSLERSQIAAAPAAVPGAAAPADPHTADAPSGTTPTPGGTTTTGASTATTAAKPDYRRAPLNSAIALLAFKGWDVEQVARIGWATARVVVQPGSDSIFLSDDTLLVGFSLADGEAQQFVVRTHDGRTLAAAASSATDLAFASPVAVTEVESIAIRYVGEATLTTALVLHLSVGGIVMPLNVPIRLRSVSVPTTVVKFGTVAAAAELQAHLEANRLHYTQAILRALDAATVAALLAPFTFRGLPLGRLVDTVPVAVMANYLVFKLNVSARDEPQDPRWSDEQAAWRAWLAQRGLEQPVPRSEIVPLPSGGLFAEAVLGRFNAAEKTDLSRFWNWQDSPIPIVAPDIAPVQTGTRAQPDAVAPGQLSAPVVAMQAPTPLPDAAGIAAIITAVQNGNMFRDMSGIAHALALAQAATQAGAAGATAAGAQAGENLSTVMSNNTERLRIAAQVAGAGGGAGTAAGARPAANVTEEGARLNYARGMDERAASSIPGGATSGVDAIHPVFGGGGSVTPPDIERMEDAVFLDQTGAGASARADRVVDEITEEARYGGPGGGTSRGRRRKHARNLRIIATFVQENVVKFQSGDITFGVYEVDGNKLRYLWEVGGPGGGQHFVDPISKGNTIDTGMLRGVTAGELMLFASVRFPGGGLGPPTKIEEFPHVRTPSATTVRILVHVEMEENTQTVAAADAGDASDKAAANLTIDPNLYFRSSVTDNHDGTFTVLTKYFTGSLSLTDENGLALPAT